MKFSAESVNVKNLSKRSGGGGVVNAKPKYPLDGGGYNYCFKVILLICQNFEVKVKVELIHSVFHTELRAEFKLTTTEQEAK